MTSERDKAEIRIRSCATLNQGMENVKGQLAGANINQINEQLRVTKLAFIIIFSLFGAPGLKKTKILG